MDDLDGDGFADFVGADEDGDHRLLRAHRGGPGGFDAEPLWTVEPVLLDDLFWNEWSNVGLGVVRPPGSDRLVVTRAESGYHVDVVVGVEVWGDVGSAPVVVQAADPLANAPWWVFGSRPGTLHWSSLRGEELIVLDTGDGLAWAPWDSVQQELGSTPTVYAPYSLDHAVGPGPFVSVDWKAGENAVWGWTLPADPLVMPAADDPRLEDCGPLPHAPPETTTPISDPATGPEEEAPSLDRGVVEPAGCGCGSGGSGPGWWVPLLVGLTSVSRPRPPGSTRLRASGRTRG